jgi:hypothetical protein
MGWRVLVPERGREHARQGSAGLSGCDEAIRECASRELIAAAYVRKEDPMTITLQDPTRQRDPSSRHAFPDLVGEPKLRASQTLAEELLTLYQSGGAASEISVELESRGGYARTVTGTVAYLDDEAQTLMVRVAAGRVVRVPLRDITSAHDVSTEPDRSIDRDIDGLGTGSVGTVDRISPAARIG